MYWTFLRSFIYPMCINTRDRRVICHFRFQKGEQAAADFFSTIKAVIHHESVDSQEDRQCLGCHSGQGLLWFFIWKCKNAGSFLWWIAFGLGLGNRKKKLNRRKNHYVYGKSPWCLCARGSHCMSTRPDVHKVCHLGQGLSMMYKLFSKWGPGYSGDILSHDIGFKRTTHTQSL